MVRHSLLFSKEGLLNHVLFLKTNIDEDKGRFPRPIIDWPEQHLGTSRATPGPPQDEYIGDRDENILNELPAVLNVAVFNEALPRSLYTWKFVRQGTSEWEENNDGEKSMRTSIDRRRARPNTINSAIEVFETFAVRDGEEYSSAKHIHGYIGTQLHGMVHSLISIYVCDCPICYIDPNNPDGKTRHGEGSVELALEIKVFAKKMMKIELDLGILEAVAIELLATGESAHDWPLEELGICLGVLEEEMAWRAGVIKVTNSGMPQAVLEDFHILRPIWTESNGKIQRTFKTQLDILHSSK